MTSGVHGAAPGVPQFGDGVLGAQRDQRPLILGVAIVVEQGAFDTGGIDVGAGGAADGEQPVSGFWFGLSWEKTLSCFVFGTGASKQDRRDQAEGQEHGQA